VKGFSLVTSLLLLAMANQAQAWWNNPYAYSPSRMSYWPSVWPAYVQPQFNNGRHGYNKSGWHVKGTMNRYGDTHFIMEYHGNINDMWRGNNYGYPAYQNYMNGWRR